MDEINKIWTPKKKDQSADTNTPPEINKFLPYPSEKTQRSKDADAHNPSEMAFSNPFRNSRPWGGVYIKWNGPMSNDDPTCESPNRQCWWLKPK
jgi:hypothetical protein